MKKDKLYTVNRWNRRMLDDSYPSSSSYYSHPSYNRLIGQDGHKYEGGGWADSIMSRFPRVSIDTSYSLGTSNNSSTSGLGTLGSYLLQNDVGLQSNGSYNFGTLNQMDNLLSNSKGFSFGTSKQNNFFSKDNIGGTLQAGAGAILSTEAGDKLLDTMDPVYHLAGGRESAVGNGLNDVGKGLFKAGVTSGNGFMMLAGAGAKVLGGLTNAAFGSKINKENVANVENNIRGMRSSANALAGSNDNASLIENFANTNMGYNFGNSYIGKDGWFSSKAKKKANNLRNQQNVARDVVGHELADASEAVTLNRRDNLLAHSAAFGGPIEMMANNDNMGAIGYGLMSDYLTMRNNQTQNKGNMISYLGNMPNEPLTYGDGGGIYIKKSHEGRLTELKKRTGKTEAELWAEGNPSVRKMITFARNARKWHGDGGLLDSSSSLNSYSSPYSLIGNNDTLFALGGDLQTNGSDWSTGLTHVDEGGRHEENPYEGVQFGVAEDGEPNLVEEGETVFNDFVFSDRIRPTKEVLRKFHIYSKGGKMTYADVSKRLEKEAQERPNDAISQAALKKMLEQLAEAQEEQKAEEEAKRAKEAFEALSPEEQQQVLAQIAAQQQAATEQQPTEQMAEEDATAMQQPTQQEDMPIEQNEQEMQGYAEGGKIGHKYPTGGKVMLNDTFGRHTDRQWNEWAAKQGLKDFDYSKIADIQKYIMDNETFRNALAKENAAFVDALNRTNGALLGSYTPNALNYDFNGYNSLLKRYNGSKTEGNKEGNYAVDTNFPMSEYGDYADAKALEGQQFYKDYTNDVVGAMDRAKGLKWRATDNGFEVADNGTLSQSDYDLLNATYNQLNRANFKGGVNPVFSTDDGWISLKDNAGNYYRKNIREDGNLGTGHLTPKKITRGNNETILLDNGDGTFSEFTGDTTGYDTVNTYTYDTPEASNTIRYIKAAAPKTASDEDEEDIRKLPYRKYGDLFQLAGVAGPAIGLASWLAGVGKPDTSGLDAAVESVGSPSLASYQPVGSYLTYRPMDIWAQQNQNRADAMGMARALGNSNSPTRNASLVALANNTINNNGNLLRQAQEYNNNLAQQIANYNRGTDIQNANAFDQMSQFNADARNKNRQYRASLLAQNESQKLGARSAWDNAWYGNVGNVANALSNYGRHIDEDNLLRALVNSGAIGGVNDELGIMAGVRNGRKSAAKGGKLKKRKGLTF